MKLIELQNDETTRAKFMSCTDISIFYKQFLPANKYPILRDNGRRFISLFGTTYKCEQFFSRMKATKTAHRNRLTDMHLEQTLKVCVSTVRPDINGLVKKVQAQHSH
ncbi:GTF2IRD2B (predicted) [Pycnogonum litorale]